MYLILKQEQKNIIVSNIEDFFNSNIGGLYQVKGFLETLADVLDIKGNKDTINKVKNSLDILKERTAKLDYKFNESFYNMFDKAKSKNSSKTMKKAINKIVDYLNKIVQKYARQFIRDNHISYKKYIS
jgi:hypothetical protein